MRRLRLLGMVCAGVLAVGLGWGGTINHVQAAAPACPGTCQIWNGDLANPSGSCGVGESAISDAASPVYYPYSCTGYDPVIAPVGTAQVCCAVVITPMPCDQDIDENGNPYQVNPLLRPGCALQELPNLVGYVVNIAIVAAAILALIFILLGGFYYAWSMDDPKLQEQARKTIQWAVIGLIFAASAFVIMQVIAQTFHVPGFGLGVGSVYAQGVDEPVLRYQVSGKVYDQQTHEVLAGSDVRLYQKQEDKWVLWPARDFDNQRNPFTADSFGQYHFFVSPGDYRVEAGRLGFFAAKSEVISVVDRSLTNDLYLERAPMLWMLFLIFGLVALVGMFAYVGVRAVNVWRRRMDLKQMVQRELDQPVQPDSGGNG